MGAVAPGSRRWLGAVLLVAASNQMREMWRFAAFVVSGVAFAAHIAYEHFRLRTSPAVTAWHTSLAAALGGFALAVAANVHEHFTASSHRGLLIAALVIWPALTGVPAFLVAWGAAAGLSLRRASR